MILEIMRSPAKSIVTAKRKGEKHLVHLLLFNSLIAALGVGLLLIKFSLSQSLFVSLAIATSSTVFLLVFFSSFVLGYILQITTNTLGGNGKYLDGLATVVYSLTPVSFGVLVSSLILFVPWLGIVLAMLIMAVTSALGFAMLYRGVKEFFRTDMLVSLVSISVVIMSVIIAVYSLAMLNYITRLAGV